MQKAFLFSLKNTELRISLWTSQPHQIDGKSDLQLLAILIEAIIICE